MSSPVFCLHYEKKNDPKNKKLPKTRKCLSVIEPAEMGLHGTFGNLHTYLLFRTAQLPSVSGAIMGPGCTRAVSLQRHRPAQRVAG